MANPSQIPRSDAPDAEVADFFAKVAGLLRAVQAEQLAAVAPVVGRRPPREHIGPSPMYRQLEHLLGYRKPTGYRAAPSGPGDFDPLVPADRPVA